MWFINHPNCNASMAAPPGLEGKVETLCIRDVRYGGLVGAARQMTSYWLPSAEDLRVLNAGGTVALTIHSPSHPIISMAVEEKP